MNSPRPGDPRLDSEWLVGALREQADEHEADLRRVQEGFERVTAGKPRRTRSQRLLRPARLRLIGVPLGVLISVATATVALGVTLGITAHTAHPANQATPSSSPMSTAQDHQPSKATSSAAGRTGPTSPTSPTGTATTRTQSSPSASAGSLTATGTVDAHSNQFWGQGDVTVASTRAIRTLHMTVTVSGGTSVQSTGWWSTIVAPNVVTTTVSRVGSNLVYDVSLKPGQTLQPGTYVFGFQFNHPVAGHNFAADTYAITATFVSDEKKASATGTFGN